MAVLFLGGCTSVISPELRKEARAGLTLAQVSRNPDMYWGATVIWGGVIQDLKSVHGETYLKVAETPLDWHQFPGRMDSVRRTFAVRAGFLEPEIYAKGRRVRLAGRIEGRSRVPWQGPPWSLYARSTCGLNHPQTLGAPSVWSGEGSMGATTTLDAERVVRAVFFVSPWINNGVKPSGTS